MMLDTRLDYENHIKSVLSKVKEKVGLFAQISNNSPQKFFDCYLQILH